MSPAAICTVLIAVPAAGIAQPVELPEVVITTPSPVSKPKLAKAPTKTKALGQAAGKPAAKKSKSAAVPPAPPAQPATPPAPTADAGSEPSGGIKSLPGAVIAAGRHEFAAITVATDAEIAATRGATLTDVLQSKPGIAGSTFAPGANRPVIRGLDNNRVRIQENGIGAHDVSALSEDHAVPIDPYAAERVEVIRGPATLRYGSQAIGGVVAVENERIPTERPAGGVSAEVRGGMSSVDDGLDGAFRASQAVEGIVVHVDGSRRTANDYDTPLGRQINSYVDSEGLAAGASIVGSDGFLGVAFTRFESLYGIPGVEAAAERSRIDLGQDKLLGRGEWRAKSSGIDAVRLWFGASDYAHNEVVEDGEIGSRFTNREQEARVEIQHLPSLTAWGELNGALGAQFDRRKTRGESFEGDNLLEPAKTRSLAAYWFEELHVADPWRVQAAARIEQAQIDGTGVINPLDPVVRQIVARETSFVPVSASLGTLYDLPLGTVARLTAQYVERAPDAAELFSKGAHEATGTFEIGNPDLAKEKAVAIEAGVKRADGDLRFEMSGYYTRFNGFIFKRLTGETCDDDLASCTPAGAGTELDQLVFDQRDAEFYGVELAAQHDVAPIWNGVWGIDAQYDFVRATFEGGENVPRIPPHRLGAGLFYRDQLWYARAGLLHAFRQDDIAPNETPTSGYSLLSAELSYTTGFENAVGPRPQVTVGLKGENLLDDDVRNHVSFKKNEVLLPGASVRLFGILRFN